jgi:hypothetical protein
VGRSEIVITGSESFVSGEIERWEDEIRSLIRGEASSQVSVRQSNKSSDLDSASEDDRAGSGVPAESLTSEKEDKPVNERNISIDNFSHIFSYNKDKEQIDLICELPEGGKKSKVVDATILTLFGYDLIGKKEINASELRRICDMIGIRDSNFATNYKDLSPKWILVDSSESERNPSLKLTLPGKKRALSLATKIEEEGQSKIDKTLSHS